MSKKEHKGNKRIDPEVKPASIRRRFSAKEKLRILEEAEASQEPGAIGALLRRNGIYSSYLTRWRQARERGELEGLSGKQRGPQSHREQGVREEEYAALQRENERLRARLEQAEMIIDVQKKLSALLGLEQPQMENSEEE